MPAGYEAITPNWSEEDRTVAYLLLVVSVLERGRQNSSLLTVGGPLYWRQEDRTVAYLLLVVSVLEPGRQNSSLLTVGGVCTGVRKTEQ